MQLLTEYFRFQRNYGSSDDGNDNEQSIVDFQQCKYNFYHGYLAYNTQTAVGFGNSNCWKVELP